MFKGKLFALLLTIAALTGAVEAAAACCGNADIASAQAMMAIDYNPVPPSVADSTNTYHHGVLASTSRLLDDHDIFSRSPLHGVASPFLSWAQEIGTLVVEQSCLANAVYFEARSESLEGQLAVALVILNRVGTSHYPSTICGVVYQGASRLNACQFSFACDGEPDLPIEARAWKTAVAVAALALGDDNNTWDEQMWIVSTATHYHADYVKPKWSKSLHRLTKIGRHIFYSQS